MSTYVVATIKDWNIDAYQRHHGHLAGDWHLISQPQALTLEALRALKPKYVFFPHWSWIVPQAILQEFDCVCFHMTDLPYGRGGSPLQNLIANGHKDTKLTALKMTSELDAGPIYTKRPLSLEGSAKRIFRRSAELTWEIIKDMVEQEPSPNPQQGKVTEFTRRTPEQSELQWQNELEQIYDHVRMLDAESYPHAFHKVADKLLHFTDIKWNEDGELVAQVKISKSNK